MKTVIIKQYGSVNVLEHREVALPSPKSKDLLIEVHSTSINPVDWKIRKGELKIFSDFKFPKKLGSDFAGEVKSVGAEVKLFQPGDKVFGFIDPLQGGGYSEHLCVNESLAVKIPYNARLETIGVVPLAGMTALQGLNIGKIESNSRILINGASGGVGSFAVQIARLFSSSVTGVCSYRNLELVKSLGATKVIDYTKQNFLELPDKYDLIFDTVGTQNYYNCKHILNPKGVYVTTLPEFKNILAILQTSLFGAKKAKLVVVNNKKRTDLENLSNWLEHEMIKLVLDRTYSIDEIREAHLYSEQKRTKGKILVKIV